MSDDNKHNKPWWHFDSKYVALVIVLIVVAAYFLEGCSSAPRPFKEGVEVAPPAGCVEYRKAGGEC